MGKQKKSRDWLIFVLVALAQFMVVLDVSITNVALPSIQASLGFSEAMLPWIIAAYALAFGGFLLLGGRSADLFGRRKTLLAGMLAFIICSFLVGISAGATALVILRALQGLAAAFMSPSALSIVLVTFSEETRRNKALGYWPLVGAGGAAAGLVFGGILTQYLSWKWDFFVNVPIGIILSILILRYVPPHEKEEAYTGLDVKGAVLITLGLMALVLAFSVAPLWGWLALRTLLLFLVATLFIGAFIWNENAVRYPLIPLSIFHVRNITGANIIMALLYSTMFSTFYLTVLFLQEHMHLRPLITGLAFLPVPFLLGFTSTRMPKLVGKFGYKPFLIIGPTLVAVALLWMARVPSQALYVRDILPSLLLLPIGIGTTMMPTYASATAGVPAHKAGLASGLVSTAQQTGGAIGLSVLAGIADAVGIQHSVRGYHAAFIAGTLFVIAAIIISIFVIQEQKEAGKKEKTIVAEF